MKRFIFILIKKRCVNNPICFNNRLLRRDEMKFYSREALIDTIVEYMNDYINNSP